MHLLDKTNFKGLFPGLKTTKLLYIVLNVCMQAWIYHDIASWQIYAACAFIYNYILGHSYPRITFVLWF